MAFITPVLYNLQCQPVKQCIIYRLLLLPYKILNSVVTKRIYDFISLYVPIRNLRSVQCKQLACSKQLACIINLRTFKCFLGVLCFHYLYSEVLCHRK